jgi:hypothetical protein
VVDIYNPSYVGKIAVLTALGIRQESISKITNAKRSGRVNQVVEPLCSKNEAFNPKQKTTKKEYSGGTNKCLDLHKLYVESPEVNSQLCGELTSISYKTNKAVIGQN